MELEDTTSKRDITREIDQDGSKISMPNVVRKNKRKGKKKSRKKFNKNGKEELPALKEDTTPQETHKKDGSMNDLENTEPIIQFNGQTTFVQNQIKVDNLTRIPSRPNSIGSQEQTEIDRDDLVSQLDD